MVRSHHEGRGTNEPAGKSLVVHDVFVNSCLLEWAFILHPTWTPVVDRHEEATRRRRRLWGRLGRRTHRWKKSQDKREAASTGCKVGFSAIGNAPLRGHSPFHGRVVPHPVCPSNTKSTTRISDKGYDRLRDSPVGGSAIVGSYRTSHQALRAKHEAEGVGYLARSGGIAR